MIVYYGCVKGEARKVLTNGLSKTCYCSFNKNYAFGSARAATLEEGSSQEMVIMTIKTDADNLSIASFQYGNMEVLVNNPKNAQIIKIEVA